MRDLPYYRMWVKDFEVNENVRMLNLAEAGLYLFALNHAWVNDGLPESPDDIRRVLKVPSKEFNRYWPLVSRCFTSDGAGRLRNKRQEEERTEAGLVSERARSNVRKRYQKPTTVEFSYASGSTRAYDPGSVVGSSVEDLIQKPDFVPREKVNPFPFEPPRPEDEIHLRAFEAWCSRWVYLTRRRTRVETARSVWFSVVKPEDIPSVMSCLERYGASRDVARGTVMNPDGWICEQARDQWRGDWPPVTPPPNSGGGGRQSRVKNALAEAIAEAELEALSGEINGSGSSEITWKIVAYSAIPGRKRRIEGASSDTHASGPGAGNGREGYRRAA